MYSHIMDPRTGYPATGVLSASVIAPRTLMSEAWTKPFFILGRDWAAKARSKGLRVFLCEDGAKLHARGSNEQPLSGCLPAPAHRCAAGVVHAAGGTLSEAVSRDPFQARNPGDLQTARPGGRSDAPAGRDPGRGRSHHLRRPAAAGRGHGAEAPLRRRARGRSSTTRCGRRRTWTRCPSPTRTISAMSASRSSSSPRRWRARCPSSASSARRSRLPVTPSRAGRPERSCASSR